MMRHAILFLLMLPAALSSFGQIPSQERGFKPELVYHVRDLDTVNLLNGNLNLVVPLGGTYPVASGLSYSFVLRYAGNSWRSAEWERFTYNQDHESPAGYTRIAADENAGMGWNLSFGQLRAPNPNVISGQAGSSWRYESADGSVHVFFPTLHEPVCASGGANCDLSTAGVSYTRDGSYLRMKNISEEIKVVEFPDGRRQRFKRYEMANPEVWLLEDIYTASSELEPDGRPANAYVRFSYTLKTTIVDGAERHWYDWNVKDSHGREHTVQFAPPQTSRRRERAQTITLRAFGGGTATYSIAYERKSVPRKYDTAHYVDLSFLTDITMPSGEKFLFGYAWSPTPSLESSLMTSMTLPTKGSIHWTYRQYGFSVYDEATGVATRIVKSAAGDILERTDYTSQLTSTSPGRTSITTVTKCKAWTSDPAVPCTPEFRTEHHHVSEAGAQFGLAYNALQSIGTSDGTRYLSSVAYDCSQSADCGDAQKTTSTYVRYELDQSMEGCNQDYTCGRDRNRRVVGQRTVFEDDAQKFRDVLHSDFDGLGHYRKSVTNGNFTSGNVRETVTSYNSSVGTYALDQQGKRTSGFTMMGAGDSWVLGTYTSTSVVEGTSAIETKTCFDPSTGFLKARRMVRNRNYDLVAIFTPDNDGNVAKEEYFGGDGHTLPNQTLCSMAPSHNGTTFRLDHKYQSGSPSETRYYDSVAGTDMPFLLRKDIIDIATGLVSKSHDTGDLATEYVYDASGRLTSVKPPATNATTYTYHQATAQTPASVLATTTATDSYQTIQQEYIFDSLGRVWREKRKTYDGSWVVRQTDFLRGFKSSVSEWENFSDSYAPSKKTLFGKYDGSGRPREITVPDGSKTTYTYTGERLITRKVNVKTSAAASSDVLVREERDAAGRLIAVTENADAAGAKTTTYAYDAGNRLTHVKMTDDDFHQERFFTYDGAGLLTQEQHPESGTATYSYDARGQFIARSHPSPVTIEYDAAGRTTAVKDAAQLLVKLYSYDTAPAGTGRLASATRYNRTVIGEVIVTETFEYDTGGRVSRKTTAVSGAAGNTSFVDEYTYDAMGQLQSLKYPTCTGCTDRTLSMSYSRGFLTDIGRYTFGDASSQATGGGSHYPITYNPDGGVARIIHANADSSQGPSYEQSNDGGIGRLGKIEVTGFCTDFAITQQPQSATIAPGGSTTLSVTAPGSTSYQWFQGNSATPISGQTGNTITVSPSATTTYRVRARKGNCYSDSNVVTVTVQGTCSTPDTTITLSASSMPGGSSGAASVPNAGSGATYAWSITNGTILSGHTTRSITFAAGCSGTVRLNVTVTNGQCDAPGSADISIVSATASLTGTKAIQLGQSAQLSVALTGVSPWTLRWSDGRVDSNITNSPFTRTVAPTSTTSYWIDDVDDAHGCGTASGEATVTVSGEPPPAPTGLVATGTGPNHVTVTWMYGGPAVDEFQLYRNGALIYTGSATSYPDFVQSDAAYRYHVIAVRYGLPSPQSQPDVATTVMFDNDPLQAGHSVKISAAHITQLRTAVNALRALAGLPAMTLSRTVVKGAGIRVIDFMELRAPLNEARQLLNVPQATFAQTPLTGVIKAQDMMELRRGVQ